MTLDRLFSQLMQTDRLLMTIGNNIGGLDDPPERLPVPQRSPTAAAPPPPSAGIADARPGLDPAQWAAQSFGGRPQGNGLVSHTLLGLRPAMSAASAKAVDLALPLSAAPARPAQAAGLAAQVLSTAAAAELQDAASPSASATPTANSASPAGTAPTATPAGAQAAVAAFAAGADATANVATPPGQAADAASTDQAVLQVTQDASAEASDRPTPSDVRRAQGARPQRPAQAASQTAAQAANTSEAGRRAADVRPASSVTTSQVASPVNVRTAIDLESASAAQASGSKAGIDESWATLALLAPSTAERAGIIESAILNAAMIPGWPAPRPFELAAGRPLVPAGQPPIDENEAMNYLAKMGASPTLLGKIRELLRNLVKRAKLLLGLAVLATLMTSAIKTLQDELAALAEELEAAQAEELVGGRRHISG